MTANSKRAGKIMVLHHEKDSYEAEIVRAALCRSFTETQVEACSYSRCNVSASCAVLINPVDTAAPILATVLNSGGKALLFGHIGPRIADQLEVELRAEAVLKPELAVAELNPFESFNVSPARVRYAQDHPVARAAIVGTRPLCRYDFNDEWNNLGYGRILFDGSPWGIAVSAMTEDSRCIATIEDQTGLPLSVYAVLFDAPNGAALWVNRGVGPVDSVEWAMVEFFVGEYRVSELANLPYIREIPFGYSGAVTVRLDCDQAVGSASRLFDLYSSKGLPLSMAVATGLNMTSRDLSLLREIVDRGGSVVSHSEQHYPDWGGSYEAALREALTSKEWIENNLNGSCYAVSPFHQNPIHAVQALADAGYKGFVGGSIRNDPEFLLGRAGRVPLVGRAIVSHSQQCMLHGDCYHRYGETIRPYQESFALHFAAGAFFGYLDHPFSEEYQYGWASEEERLGVHEAFIDHILATDGLWWCSLEQCLDFLVTRDSCSLCLDDWGTLRFTCGDSPSEQRPSAVWKGEIRAPL